MPTIEPAHHFDPRDFPVCPDCVGEDKAEEAREDGYPVDLCRKHASDRKWDAECDWGYMDLTDGLL